MSKSYHILGLLMLLQLSITSIHRLYKVWSFLGGQKRQQFNSWKFIKCFLLFSEEYVLWSSTFHQYIHRPLSVIISKNLHPLPTVDATKI